ncbi:MAG TPA: hypothetical protein VKE41_09515 [Roseiflexaceae bacterium]|nr:hypothetical protein [Roseiflexaceae bacterium]
MELVGVADVVSDWRIKVAVEKGFPVLASTAEAMHGAGLPVAGNLGDILSTIDVVADATPKKVASANLERYLGRPRGDMWEVGLWEDSLTVKGNELFYNYQVYNQAIVVPETVDAIRALTGIEENGLASIAKTGKALGLVREFLG